MKNKNFATISVAYAKQNLFFFQNGNEQGSQCVMWLRWLLSLPDTRQHGRDRAKDQNH